MKNIDWKYWGKILFAIPALFIGLYFTFPPIDLILCGTGGWFLGRFVGETFYRRR